MKKTIKLTESQLNSIIKGVMLEQDETMGQQSPELEGEKKSTENILNAEHKVKIALIKYLEALASNGQYPSLDQYHNIIDRYINYYIPAEITKLHNEKTKL